MAQHGLAPASPRAARGGGSSAWAGMAFFAGLVLILLGALNGLIGLVAVLDSDWLVVTDTALLTVDIAAWGWFWVVMGGVFFATGLGIFAGRTWARGVGVALATVNAVGHVLYMPVYPLWSVLVLTLDVLVIYALTRPGGWD